MVKSLCSEFSPPLVVLPPPSDGIVVDTDMVSYYPFPQPSVLAAPEVVAKLRTLGFGYRAEFLQKTAKMLVDAHGPPDGNPLEPAEKWLHTLRTLPTGEARAELIKLMGVGRKVADCILLMSLDKVRLSRLPMDSLAYTSTIADGSSSC